MSKCVPDLGTCKVRTDNRYDEKDHWVPQIPKADSLATAKPGGSRPQHARPGRTARGAALLCAKGGDARKKIGCVGVRSLLRSIGVGARRGAPAVELVRLKVDQQLNTDLGSVEKINKRFVLPEAGYAEQMPLQAKCFLCAV